MNKVPDKELTSQIVKPNPILRNADYEKVKHSAHMVHRSRAPSIGHNIQILTEISRLNLKTREEQVSKRNMLNPMPNGPNERFDVSVDLSQQRGNSGFSIVQTSNTKNHYLPQMKNNMINSNFLQQSEILRMKPDSFRRISIQTDVEFGRGTHIYDRGVG